MINSLNCLLLSACLKLLATSSSTYTALNSQIVSAMTSCIAAVRCTGAGPVRAGRSNAKMTMSVNTSYLTSNLLDVLVCLPIVGVNVSWEM